MEGLKKQEIKMKGLKKPENDFCILNVWVFIVRLDIFTKENWFRKYLQQVFYETLSNAKWIKTNEFVDMKCWEAQFFYISHSSFFPHKKTREDYEAHDPSIHHANTYILLQKRNTQAEADHKREREREKTMAEIERGTTESAGTCGGIPGGGAMETR